MAEAAPDLLERDDERAALEALLAAAADGTGRAVVLEGPAGIGKTRLLRHAVAAAPGRGLAALSARAGELERDFPFGVARQLVEARVLGADADRRRALLEGPARRAAAALDLPDGGAGDTEPSAAAHGLLWLVAALAREQPLLLAVDDLQWADEPSLRFLAHLVPRLGDLPVGLVATLRAGEPAGAAVDVLREDPAVTWLRPRPLGRAAVARLVRGRLGADADPALADALRERTGGNPFLLDELLGELAEGAPAAALGDLVPARVQAALRRRLARLGPQAQALAASLVVLGDGAEAGLVAAHAGLDPHGAVTTAARLAEADLLEAGPELRFRHPLVRAAAAAGLDPGERGRGHARAARVLADRGASAARVAVHLLAAPPGGGDPWVVATLREAARTARHQGAPEQAVAPLRRALAEPAGPGDRPGLLRELGRAELAAMQPEAAARLQAALEAVAEPAERADLALELSMAHYRVGAHHAAVEVLLAALDELGDDPDARERRLRLESALGIAGRYDLATEPAVRGRIHRLARGLGGETPGERLVLAVAALEAPGPAAAGLVDAARRQEAVMEELPWPDPSEGIGTVAMYLHGGRPDLAGAAADRLLERARHADSPRRHAMGLFARGTVRLDVGTLEEAETDLRQAMADTWTAGPTLRAAGAGQLALVLAERGALDEADALLRSARLDGDVPEQMVLNPLLHARACLRLAQGRWEAAADDALELGRRHERWDLRRPSPNWRALAAEALRARGEEERARGLADEALRLARTWGTAKAIGTALRVHALAGPSERRRATLDEALALLQDSPWPLEAARVRLELGAHLRRGGERRAAREHLTAAMDAAHRCGATGLAARAADELRATGARPRRHAVAGHDALTAAERRVAALAAAGRSNRDIAQELFVTVATVETHLRRTYRKLGVDGRGALAAALEAGQAATGSSSTSRLRPRRLAS